MHHDCSPLWVYSKQTDVVLIMHMILVKYPTSVIFHILTDRFLWTLSSPSRVMTAYAMRLIISGDGLTVYFRVRSDSDLHLVVGPICRPICSDTMPTLKNQCGVPGLAKGSLRDWRACVCLFHHDLQQVGCCAKVCVVCRCVCVCMIFFHSASIVSKT